MDMAINKVFTNSLQGCKDSMKMLILLLHLLHYATAPFAYLFFSFRAYIALSLSFFLYLFWLDLSLQYQINKGDFAFFCFFLCVFYFGNNWEKKKSKKRFGFGLCFSFYHLTSTCYTISLSARRAKKNGHVAMYCSCWWFHVYTLIYGLSQKMFPGYFCININERIIYEDVS